MWSTGLLSIFDDFEIYSNATNCCGAGILLMPPRVGLEIFDGGPTCPIPVDALVKTMKGAGCHEKDVALTLNATLFFMLPSCTHIYWRKQLRNYYSIEGSIWGDIFSSLFCFPCAVCQESREVKRRGGGGYGNNLPEQQRMK